VKPTRLSPKPHLSIATKCIIVALYAEGHESGVNAALDTAGGVLGGISSLYDAAATGARALQDAAELDSASHLAALRGWAWGTFAAGLSGISRTLSVFAFGIGLYGQIGVANCS
jgi:hypothetical protein